MRPRLSARRRLAHSMEWTHVNHLLELPRGTDPSKRSPSQSGIRPVSAAPRWTDPCFRYEAQKRAFQANQDHRAELIARFRDRMDRVEDTIRNAEDASRMMDRRRVPLKVFEDDYTLEQVIVDRNAQYEASSRLVGHGRVPNLQSLHDLPRERDASDLAPARVFSWG